MRREDMKSNDFARHWAEEKERDRLVFEEHFRRIAQRRRRQRRDETAVIVALTIILLVIFGSGVALGRYMCTRGPAEAPQQEISAAPTGDTVTSAVGAVEKSFVVSQEITSDGNLLSYELQELMQRLCERYELPYALALAVAEQESRFETDAVSLTNDHGIMQINEANFGWLAEKGIDPSTVQGNIEAGVIMLSERLERYGDVSAALMAYNCGDTGAQRLWDEGVTSTAYSRSVMARYDKWAAVLEGL